LKICEDHSCTRGEYFGQKMFAIASEVYVGYKFGVEV